VIRKHAKLPSSPLPCPFLIKTLCTLNCSVNSVVEYPPAKWVVAGSIPARYFIFHPRDGNRKYGFNCHFNVIEKGRNGVYTLRIKFTCQITPRCPNRVVIATGNKHWFISNIDVRYAFLVSSPKRVACYPFRERKHMFLKFFTMVVKKPS
jgi:hypothetical protein